MNKDFHNRVARLEAKHGASDQLAYTVPGSEPVPSTEHVQSDESVSRSGMFKMIAFGLVCLILVPAGAIFVTINLP